MTRANARDRLQFEQVLVEAGRVPNNGFTIAPDVTVNAARLLMRHGATYGRLAEIECSVELTQRQQTQLEKRQEQLERRIRQIVATLGEGFDVNFSGDPRGYTVKITLPTKRYNTWGGEESGWGVPTS